MLFRVKGTERSTDKSCRVPPFLCQSLAAKSPLPYEHPTRVDRMQKSVSQYLQGRTQRMKKVSLPNLEVLELLSLYSEILNELLSRDVMRTINNPAADSDGAVCLHFPGAA